MIRRHGGRVNLLIREEAPLDVVLRLGSLVFVAERHHDLLGIVELVQVLCEHRFLPVVVQEGISRPQFVVLLDAAVEQLADCGVVGHHEAIHLVGMLDVGALSRQGDLDARRAPLHELRQLPFPYSLWIVEVARGRDRKHHGKHGQIRRHVRPECSQGPT